MKKYRGWLRLAGVVLLVALVLFFKVDLRETFAILANANPALVALSVLGFIPFLAVKAWRWQIILRDLGVSIPFREAIRLYALGLGAGMITPGQVGDAIKIAYFRERGFGQSLISVIFDRLWDVLILVLLAATGALFFVQLFEGEGIAIVLLLVGTLALFLLINHPRVQHRLFQLLIRLRRADSQVVYEPAPLNVRQIAVQFALTILATAIVYLRLYFLTTAIGVQLDLVPFVAAMSLATMAALLPISFLGGVGTRDAALLLIAPAIGITAPQALAISTLILFIQLLNGVVGFGVWLTGKGETGEQRLKFQDSRLATNPTNLQTSSNLKEHTNP